MSWISKRALGRTLLVPWALLAACESEREPGSPLDLLPTQRDAGALGVDGGTDAPLDASADADVREGGSMPAADGGEPQGLSCALDGQPFSDVSVISSGRVFAMELVGDVLHLVYAVPTCEAEPPASPGTGLKYLSLPREGAIPAPVPLLNAGTLDCAETIDPAVVGAGAEVRAYFVAPYDAVPEVFRAALEPLSAPAPIVDSAERESFVSAVQMGAASLVFWASAAQRLPQSIQVLRDDAAPSAKTFLPVERGHSPKQLASTVLDAQLGLLAWVSSTDAARGIFLSSFDAQGLPAGSVQLVSTAQAPGGSVDLAARADGSGAVLVYDATGAAGRELRFRTIDADGRLVGSESVVSTGQPALDPGIAASGAGFAIAYRSLQAGAGAEASIRVAFTDEAGGVLRSHHVLSAATSGSPVRIRSTSDGRLFMVWVDAAATGTRIHAVRATCSQP